MSTFNHNELMRDINASLAPFRNTQGHAMAGFGQLVRAAIGDGALPGKHKDWIALAIAVAERCSGCIGFHAKALLPLGCTRAEREEMLTVGRYMGGGPALMNAAEALAAWDPMPTDTVDWSHAVFDPAIVAVRTLRLPSARAMRAAAAGTRPWLDVFQQNSSAPCGWCSAAAAARCWPRPSLTWASASWAYPSPSA